MNAVRGETQITVAGTPYVVALNLGTLAELESIFGLDDFADIFADMGSARTLLKLISGVLKADGHDVPDDVVRGMTAREAMDAATALLNASGLVSKPEAADPAQAPLEDAERWKLWMKIGLGHLRMTPATFWGPTPVEFFRAIDGYLESKGVSKSTAGPTADQLREETDDLLAMLEDAGHRTA